MAKPISDGQAFEGSWGLLKDSNWLNSTSIPSDRDTIVTVEKVIQRAVVKFKDEEKKGYGSLKFREFDKELGLCATHLVSLAAMFKSAKDAVGQQIALYVDPDVKAFGKTVAAVRIRPTRPQTTRRALVPAAKLESLKTRLGEIDTGDVGVVLHHFGFDATNVKGKPLTAWPEAWVDIVLRYTGRDADPLPPPDETGAAS